MLNKSLKRYEVHIKNILLLLVIIFIVYAPHLQDGLFLGADDSFHLSRIYSLANSIKNGVFPVKVHSYMCYGTGYGVGFGYSNLFLYFPALLICLGLSLCTVYKIYILIILIELCLVTYFSLNSLTHKSSASLVGCIIIMFSNRIWWDLYGLMSIGSLQASVFMILAIIGMYKFLISENSNASTLMLSTGFIGLIYSHTISTYMAFSVCACLVIFYATTFIKYRRKIIKLMTAVICVTCITAAYWIPMIEQMKKQLLKVKAPWTWAEENIATMHELLSIHGLGYMPLFMLCLSFIIILYLCVQKKWSLIELYRKGSFSLIALLYIAVTMCYPFWHLMNSVIGIKIIQFPYRLYTPVTFLIAIQITILLADTNIKELSKRNRLVINGFLIILMTILQYKNYSDLFTNIDSSTIEAVEANNIAGIGGGEEWLPINGNREYMMDNEVTIDNEGNCIRGKKSQGYTTYTVTLDLSKQYYDLPFVYYKGYQIFSQNNICYDMELNYNTGMLRVLIPSSLSGSDTIVVKYIGTKYQKLAYLITLCSIFAVLFLALYRINTRKPHT